MMKIKIDTVKLDWFEKPVQVNFYDFDNERWLNGIGYKDEIICAECGGIISLEEMYDEEILAVEANPVRAFGGDWVDFSDYIGN